MNRTQAVDPRPCGTEQVCSGLDEIQNEIRDSEGPKLFQQLQKCLLKEVDNANRSAGKSEYHISYLRPRLLDLLRERRIRLERQNGKSRSLTITYFPPIHHLHIECGAKKCTYKLSVGDDGNLRFATSQHDRKSIEEVATEVFWQLRAGD
jgi:hypothetical protein